MELVIRKRDGGYEINGEPVSAKVVNDLLFALMHQPQRDRCIETLLGTGELVLARNPAEADPAVKTIHQEAEAAMRAIIKANNAICELLVSLGNTTPALNEHIAVLHGIAQEGK